MNIKNSPTKIRIITLGNTSIFKYLKTMISPNRPAKNYKLDMLTNLSDDEFVEYCYNNILGRTSDVNSKINHLNFLTNGSTRIALIERFLSSKEFKNRFSSSEFVPSGHFYSCIPSKQDIARFKSFDPKPSSIPGIDLNTSQQFILLEDFKELYKTIPFSEHKQNDLRFYYKNPAYSYMDSILLHCFIRYLQPKRIIEVGSGYSSCVILDTNELFFNDSIECTFIEPYPQLLHSLLKPNDSSKVKLIGECIQNVELSVFDTLKKGDILFIDSTHVSKVGSDVNKLIFEILPRLSEGVFIHFHDIFYPFEYPFRWLEEGRAWNENYLLRAFLQYNSSFKIRLFSNQLVGLHSTWLAENMPDCLKNPGGSIWLEKMKQ